MKNKKSFKIDFNKLLNLLIIVVIIGFIAYGSYLIVTKVVSKKVYTEETLKEKMEKLGYNVEDLSFTYEDDDKIVTYLQCRDKNNKYQLDFYVLDTDKHAKSYYNKIKKEIDTDAEGIEGKVETNKKDYYKYVIEVSGSYGAVINSKNTVIYFNSTQKNKEDIVNLLKKLGYR
ncbi:MAG: hypothetical protein IJ193_04870 [Bacilli bacterium]|nr:hypothetical protein [Bacilli bacterium]